MPVNPLFIRAVNVITPIKNPRTSKQWLRLLKEAGDIEEHYSNSCMLSAEEFQQFGNLIDEHYNSAPSNILSFYEWSFLQVKAHSEVIKIKKLLQENDQLRRQYTLLMRETTYLREKRKTKGITRRIFYS